MNKDGTMTKVTQADIDAAYDVANCTLWGTHYDYEMGLRVRFAKHRQQATVELKARIAELEAALDAMLTLYGMDEVEGEVSGVVQKKARQILRGRDHKGEVK